MSTPNSEPGVPQNPTTPAESEPKAEAGSTHTTPGAASTPPEAPSPAAKSGGSRRLLLWLVIGIVVIVIAVPRVIHALHTVSTDDAYVNSYVTFVAPRVAGQVERVAVDDNNRVKKGDLLVALDPEPYKVEVAIKQAAVAAAQADLVTAKATVQSETGQLRSLRFQLDHQIEEVDNQVALLRSRVATLEQQKAAQVFAQSEFERAKKLLDTKVISPEEYEQKREGLDAADAQVNAAAESVYQSRAALGLPHDPPDGKPLTDVPADIDQTFSGVRQAVGELMKGAAALGVLPSSYTLTPKQIVAEFYRRDPSGDVDKIYATILLNAPEVNKAKTSVEVAQRNLDQAKLDLRYCNVVAEIDGVVTRRNVNPGNYVQVGQSLMAVRSLSDMWIDANFKETQLGKLQIGQKVDIEADMYGGKEKFEGRISGFTEGTGSTLALLPAQNATGNFVKVVQRLPVRVDLVNYDPEKLPLFVGLSVEPTVDLNSTPSGPNAGKFLQEEMAAPVPIIPVAPVAPSSPAPQAAQ